MLIHMISRDELHNAEHRVIERILYCDILNSSEEIIGALKGIVEFVNEFNPEAEEE